MTASLLCGRRVIRSSITRLWLRCVWDQEKLEVEDVIQETRTNKFKLTNWKWSRGKDKPGHAHFSGYQHRHVGLHFVFMKDTVNKYAAAHWANLLIFDNTFEHRITYLTTINDLSTQVLEQSYVILICARVTMPFWIVLGFSFGETRKKVSAVSAQKSCITKQNCETNQNNFPLEKIGTYVHMYIHTYTGK